jgi:glutamyl-tRNA reductase
VKVLVIGAGRMGAIRVGDLAGDTRVTEIVVTNRNGDRARELAQQFGATTTPWGSDVDADAVVVAVGTDAHESVLRDVLPRGIPQGILGRKERVG